MKSKRVETFVLVREPQKKKRKQEKNVLCFWNTIEEVYKQIRKIRNLRRNEKPPKDINTKISFNT